MKSKQRVLIITLIALVLMLIMPVVATPSFTNPAFEKSCYRWDELIPAGNITFGWSDFYWTMGSNAFIQTSSVGEIGADCTPETPFQIVYPTMWTYTDDEGKTFTFPTGGNPFYSGNLSYVVLCTMNQEWEGLQKIEAVANFSESCGVAPVASFEASPESGYPPLDVSFNDTSTTGTSTIISWLWDFDDGYQSNHPSNASHTYLMNGTYNASLTIGDGVGTYIAFKNITVGTAPAIPGSFNLTVHVKDKAGVHLQGAHISLLPSSGPVLTNYTNSAGISNFIAVPGSAAAIIDVTKTGYPEWVEAFTIAADMTKEITMGSAGVKFYVDVKDSIYGSYIDNINFGVKNTTSGVWRNVTGHSGAIYVDSTGASYEYPLAIGQTVIVSASKTGYLPDWKSFTITQADPVQTVTLHLVNINGSAPSSGNFTAVIAAASMTTGLEIPGASITINELGRMQGANGAGVAMFFNVPVGSYTLLVGASGYQSVTSDITGTDLETVMKRVDLLPNGFHQGDDGVITDPDGNPYQPWDPDYGDGHGGYVPGGGAGSGNVSSSDANQRAANGISVFLDHIVEIGLFILLLILFWFCKKIFFS